MLKNPFYFLSSSILMSTAIACTNQVEPTQSETRIPDVSADVSTICKEVTQRYAYFTPRADYWDETCERAKKEASTLKDSNGALAIFERMIDDLYDPHIALNANNQNSPRLLPSGSDIWFENRDGNYFVSAVRPLSGAAKAGIRIGDKFIRFNDLGPEELTLTRIHTVTNTTNIDRLTWALNAAVAGRRSHPRNLEIERGGSTRSFAMEAPDVPTSKDLILSKVISEKIGYIRINNSLGKSATVVAFNRALESLRETSGLILDLRETPGGGNTSVAEPIMGRFVQKRTPYQRTIMRNGSNEDREIKPTGSWTYDKPLIVLVGRWTGSMGEGMAIGYDGMSRAKILGSQMAGLAGGTEGIKLKETGISLALPTYDLGHLNGISRHDWKPSEVDIADNGAGKDILLRKAVSEFGQVDRLPSK